MIRPCQIGLLLSVNSSLTNIIPIHKNTQTENENTNVLGQNNALFIYLMEKTIIIICYNGLNYLPLLLLA